MTGSFTIGTAANVLSHLFAWFVVNLCWKRNRAHTMVMILMSVAVASPVYHLCEDNVWCPFRLRVLTRLDLFFSQAAMTAIIQAMIPYNTFLWELLVLLAVWILQGIVLLREVSDESMLQYIVAIISASPLAIYIAYKYARHWMETPSHSRPLARTRLRNVQEESGLLLFSPDKDESRHRGRGIQAAVARSYFATLFNPRDFLTGLCFGLVGLAQFRMHDIFHSHYDLLHPAWHVYVFMGGYFLLKSAPPRGLDYYADKELHEEWEQDNQNALSLYN